MFCSKCGTKNSDGAKYCINCGNLLEMPEKDRTALNQNASSFDDNMEDDEDLDNYDFTKSIIEQVDEERKNVKPNNPIEPPKEKSMLLNELDRLFQYFSKINFNYRKLVDAGKRLSSLRKPSFIKWVLGGLLLALIIYFGLVLVHIDLFAGFFVIWALITIIGFVLSSNKYKKDKKFYEHEVISINYEITVYYNEASDCCIAYEYSDPAYMEEIIKIIRTGRADTLGNAINIMLDDIHKGKILQQQILMTQQAQRANQAAATNALMLAAILRKK